MPETQDCRALQAHRKKNTFKKCPKTKILLDRI